MEKQKKKFNLPLIETERLRLRVFEDRDLDSAWRLFNDPEVQKYLSPENRRTREQLTITLRNSVEYWKQRGFGIWCVGEKSRDTMRGYCGFQYLDQTPAIEIVFAFHKNSWGKGFATEAANASLKFGFEELKLEKMYAATHPENTASRCVLEKIGMASETRATHYGIDTITYSIHRGDFEPRDFYKLIYKNFI